MDPIHVSKPRLVRWRIVLPAVAVSLLIVGWVVRSTQTPPLLTRTDPDELASPVDPTCLPYERLRDAPLFRVGPIGFGALISEEEGALHCLLASPDANFELHRLQREASRPGRLYALWGLAVLGDDQLEELSAASLSDHSRVPIQRGCFGGEQEVVSKIVAHIRNGDYGRPRPAGNAKKLESD